MKTILLKMMTYELTVDLNVLGALMKNIIMCNMNDTTIVIVNESVGGLRGTGHPCHPGANKSREDQM